ncbi:hypothetical protein BDB00DRAFT_875798 [Zychaea mexicana]|uniref:uncharacterized protein n=1 Tax=Zychaea mexicana TaxID=64656 RepID=UPI0022FDDF64|nr:uncharacterized protein BDB00DRAFT_875798 [Zychaea mexicana]KAI9489955.1 hypothetical protein BDB00DRAFT_875798 [Zychaea mexicana]
MSHQVRTSNRTGTIQHHPYSSPATLLDKRLASVQENQRNILLAVAEPKELIIAQGEARQPAPMQQQQQRDGAFDASMHFAYADFFYEALRGEAATRPHIQDWTRFVKSKLESHFKYKKEKNRQRKLQRRAGMYEAQREDCSSHFSIECVQALSFDYMSEDETDAEETASSSTQQQECWVTKRPSRRSKKTLASSIGNMPIGDFQSFWCNKYDAACRVKELRPTLGNPNWGEIACGLLCTRGQLPKNNATTSISTSTTSVPSSSSKKLTAEDIKKIELVYERMEESKMWRLATGKLVKRSDVKALFGQ